MARILARSRRLTDLTLGVEPNNERALRLYRAMGYQTFHRYRGKNGETIVGMRMALSWPGESLHGIVCSGACGRVVLQVYRSAAGMAGKG
jgi:ribosomal protein S18 acetylase RimI-like enzyme